MNRRKPLIAVVDNDTLALRTLHRLLGAAGYEVKTSRSGEHLVAGLSRLSPDCIVIDLNVPDGSGLATIDWLDGEFPIVVITGNDSLDYYTRAMAMGVSAYLRKPLDRHLLLESIAAALPRSLRPLPGSRDAVHESKIIAFPGGSTAAAAQAGH